MGIQLLSEKTISQIAAGEVIERPASIVKELMDNAIDAGATSIEIYCEAGGKKRIEVIDNGMGIDPVDLPLAPIRHATSKIRELEDIYLSHSMGFRGEALASICHVAQLQIRSKTVLQPGYEITADSRGVSDIRPCACPNGTTITVTDLFADIPVRRQYLKSDITELGQISDWVKTYALMYPTFRFVLRHHDKELINTSGIDELQSLLAVFFGLEVTDHILPISFDDAAVTINGLISAPTLTFPNRTRQWVSVNGRMIRNPMIQRVITEAFQDFIPHRRHPLVILNMTNDPTTIDVNIHPQKTDIKFLHAGQVYEGLRRAFRQTLGRNDSLAGLGMAAESLEPNLQSELFVKSEYATSINQAPILSHPKPVFNEHIGPIPNYFQLFDTYIGIVGDEGLWLLDQHAVHERILYEKIKQTHSDNVMHQELLIPDIIEFTDSEQVAFESHRSTFRRFYLHFEPFGPRQYLIRQLPINFVGVRLKEFIQDCLARIQDAGPDIELDRPDQKEKLQMMACKAAIKAGKKLSLAEIQHLITDFIQSPSSYTCPHGRPLALLLGKKELEKWFARV